MKKLTMIEGIGELYAEKLATMGISTTEVLLERGATAHGRKEIADTAGISEKKILRWVNMCDLFRVSGVGEEYSDLLEASGVDSVPELSQRNPEHLAAKMASINAEKKLVRQVPGVDKVADWIKQAKHLSRIVSH